MVLNSKYKKIVPFLDQILKMLKKDNFSALRVHNILFVRHKRRKVTQTKSRKEQQGVVHQHVDKPKLR